MDEHTVRKGSREAARGVGRCYGAMFFIVFGSAWLLLAAYAWRRLSLAGAIAIAFTAVVMIAAVVRLQRRGEAAAQDAYPEKERQWNARRFGIVNAVTWIAVFLTFQIMPRLGYKDLSIPVVVVIVGLHFFAMPPLFQHRANQVLGGFLAAWGIACPCLWEGDGMVGYLALGAGAALWLSAAWAVKTARDLFRSADL